MLKVTNLRETDNISPLMLRAYIAKKTTALMNDLHGVRILGDSYGEDIYLPVEVVRK